MARGGLCKDINKCLEASSTFSLTQDEAQRVKGLYTADRNATLGLEHMAIHNYDRLLVFVHIFF